MIFGDFEYNHKEVILGCFLKVTDSGTYRHQFDFRDGKDTALFAQFLNDHRHHQWLAYAAMAEMSSMLRVGQSVSGMEWICLMAEASMITGTYEPMKVFRPNLLRHLEAFCVRTETTSFHKNAMRDIIIAGDRSDIAANWQDIVNYCWSDVDCLPELYEAILTVHQSVGTIWTEADAVRRGEYLKASAMLEHRSKGLPVDVEFLNRILENKEHVKALLAERCNATYGQKIYVYDHYHKRYSFKHSGLNAYIQSLPPQFRIEWEKTESGQLRLDEEYLDKLLRQYSELLEFKRTRQLMSHLNSKPLELSPDGFVKPVSIPFYTVTGRNQPMASKGFILNLTPWFRHVIKPKPDHVLIAADWSKQEIAVALDLTEDAALRAAYESEDIYLTLAKMAGAVPPEGTKQSHGIERQAYKAVQLGLGYGMGKITLGRHLYNSLNEGRDEEALTAEDAIKQASDIYEWHQKTFRDYWQHLRNEATKAKQLGSTASKDGWLYFADHDTKFTKIMNFPVQSNAAVCLREAIRMLAKTDLDVVCSLHDAIYIYCHVDDAEAHTKTLTGIMDKAARIVCPTTPIEIDVKVYDHDTGYTDERGTETLNIVKELLDRIEREGPPPLPEKPLTMRQLKKQQQMLELESVGISFGDAK